MGKYVNIGRKITANVWDAPEDNARRVVHAHVQAVRAYLTDMADNYRTNIVNSANSAEVTNRMVKKLTIWYKYLSRVAPQFSSIYRRYLR